MRHFLDIHKTDSRSLRDILEHAKSMKSLRTGRSKGASDDTQPLAGRLVALMFEKPSTRTRVSFDAGVRQLGGEVLMLPGSELQLGRGETIADTARVLSRYVDMIVLRTYSETNLLELAEHATVPVINALTDRSHPCQVMGDVLTFEEHRGPVRRRKVAWFGDGNNVCASFLHAAGQFGFDMALSCPDSLLPDGEVLEFARSRGARVEIAGDPLAAACGADLVATDAWLSMHDSDAFREERRKTLSPFRVDAALMSAAAPDALFMHCLPAYRGEEVTSEVLDGPASVVLDEAENRLHVQKAIMRFCLDK